MTAKTKNKYYNPNPLKKETGDCSVRALCKATGKDWDEVFKELFWIGFELKVMPSQDEAWREFLIRNGFEYNKLTIKKGMKRLTVDSFTRSNKEGIHVLRVANHLVTVRDGFSWDTWDSSNCSLYGYWSKTL